MKTKHIIAAIIALAAPLTAAAQTAPPITLQTYTATAYGYNPEADYDTPNGSQYLELSASITYPLAIGTHNIEPLQQQLIQELGWQLAHGTLTPTPQLYEEFSPYTGTPRKACSNASTDIEISTINEDLIIWSVFSHIYNCGAAHGMYLRNYINYSIPHNTIITLPMLLRQQAMPQIRRMLWEQAREKEISGALNITADQWPLPDTFYIDSEGIVFVYQPYEVASYAEGLIELTIYWYSLYYDIPDAMTPLAKEICGDPID